MNQLSEEQRLLVESHVGLAQSVAIAFWRRLPNVLDCDEVISVAYGGLVLAASSFDFSFRPTPHDPKYLPELAFGSFARTSITGAIQDWLRKEDHVPRRQRRIYRDARSLDTSTEEAASILGVDVERLRAIKFAVEHPPMSLHLRWDTHTEDDLTSVRGRDVVETDVLTRRIQESVVRVYQGMDPLAKSVLALRYFHGLDFVRIAENLGTTTRTVKSVHQEAVAEIHAVMVRQASS